MNEVINDIFDIINDIFDTQVAKTIDSFPSVYSKDDVIKIISDLRKNVFELDFTKSIVTEIKFQEFSSDVRSRLERFMNQADLVDTDSAEFTISYDNRIEIESINFDTDTINEELDDILLGEFQKHFGDLITNEEDN